MQIIINPNDWTRLTARTICHEPTMTLFIIGPSPDGVPNARCHAYAMYDEWSLPPDMDLTALKGEAVLMLLFLDGVIAPTTVTSVQPRAA